MGDVLIVYYSRTGKTRHVAERLAQLLEADLDRLTEKKSRSGSLGFLGATFDTLLKRRVELEHAPDPRAYKLLVLGMPVWALRPPAPVRQYLRRVDLGGKVVCAFCTSDSSGGEGTFKSLNSLLPAPLAETFHWVRPRAGDPDLEKALASWAERVRKLVPL